MENPGDEGNLVQEAEILKAFSIVAGVRCEGRRLTLMPRLPWLWDTMECVDWPVTDADGRTAAMLSRAQAQKRCFEDRVSRLVPGDIIPVRVTHLESFGAFVDIGCGLVALMTVDTLSVSRISHPRERVAVGEKLWAAVRDVGDNGSRIYMSLRELLGTWEENAALFSPAQTVTGTVRSVEEYGVFVELMPNLCGLAELRDGAAPGKHCAVYIQKYYPRKDENKTYHYRYGGADTDKTAAAVLRRSRPHTAYLGMEIFPRMLPPPDRNPLRGGRGNGRNGLRNLLKKGS